jgi:hypothetical protein
MRLSFQRPFYHGTASSPLHLVAGAISKDLTPFLSFANIVTAFKGRE